MNNECVNQMESDGSAVEDKRTLKRVKNINIVASNSFHSMNMSNTWENPIIHKKLLISCYNFDADDHIAPKCLIPCNEENVKRSKKAREYFCGNSSGHGKGFQQKNDRCKWKIDKDKNN